jgi:hypothetical protein
MIVVEQGKTYPESMSDIDSMTMSAPVPE